MIIMLGRGESMIFDTHAHYDSGSFNADRYETLEAVHAAGVGLILDPGCDARSSRMALDLAEKYPFVYAAVGIHPEDMDKYDLESYAEICEMARHPKCVAIGEVGLDYYWEKDAEKRQLQQRVFLRQLDLARQLHLPVCIHDRDAHGDVLELLKREGKGLRGVLHCFSGSWEMAREIFRMGWFIGVDGPLTFKNAAKLPEILRQAPRDMVLVETDSPYMAPTPMRGKRNEPAFVRYVAEKIAALRGLTLAEVAAATTRNAETLYGLGKTH